MLLEYEGKVYKKNKPAGNEFRSVSPFEAMESMKDYLDIIGVTRILDLTGLNRSGIPCVNAVRPDMINPSISHGKGRTLDQARASAAGEAIERYHCFNFRGDYVFASHDNLSRKHPVPPPELLPLSRHSLFSPCREESWIQGWDIVNREQVFMPSECVNFGVDLPARVSLSSFQKSSNGLSSAMSFPEAVLQGLLEAIERDAVACAEMQARTAGEKYPLNLVDQQTIESKEVLELLSRLKNADIEPLVFDCTADTQVPVYVCYIADLKDASSLPAMGMGASLDPAAAMIRAITEAVQADVAFHSGSRDMVFKDQAIFVRMAGTRELLKVNEKRRFRAEAQGHPPALSDTFEGDIFLCIERLKQAGLERVIVLDLTFSGYSGSVVKVMVPGLEGYSHLPFYSPGPRARAHLAGGTS